MSKFIKNPFILVDGSFYIYRAYYAFSSLSNSNGEPTGAIYGVINMLRNLIIKYNPSNIAIIFDDKKKHFGIDYLNNINLNDYQCLMIYVDK